MAPLLKRRGLASALVIVAAGLVGLPANQAQASVQTTLYASPSGSGTTCSSASPCALSEAQTQVRAAAPSMTGDLVVDMMAGTYPAGISFTSADSGHGGYRVVYQADPAAASGSVVVSGGVPISGWSLYDSNKNIYQANVPTGFDARQIWVNGVRASVASAQAADVFGTMSKTATGYTYTSTGPNSWTGTGRVVLAYNNGWAWTYAMCPTTSIGSGTITVAQPCFGAANAGSGSGDAVGLPSEVQNNYALLTQPGQFYVDTSANKIYYIPRQAETMASATVIGAQLDPSPQTQTPQTQTPTLLSGQGVQNLTVQGITFSYGTWTMDRTGYVDAQANALLQCGGSGTTSSCLADEQTPSSYLKGQRMLPAAVACHACQNVTFQRNVFSHLGSSGLTLDGGGISNTVNGNVFRDISGNGINVGTGYADTASWQPAAYEDGTTVSNNYMFDIANEYLGGVGIYAGWVKNTYITHNEIGAVSYSGISLGWGAGAVGTSQMTNNHIDNNFVHDVLTSSVSDGGAIYLNGTQQPNGTNGNTISGNHVEDQGGRFSSLYLDDGASNWAVSNNVVDDYTPSWVMSKSSTNSISNNYISAKAGGTYGGVYQQGSFANNTTGLTTWPAAAQAIMAAAGVQPAYADIIPGGSEVDLAYGAPTRSSGDNGAYVSGRAVDGWNGESGDPGGWISGGTTPYWWQVDLGASNTLSKIELVMRQDADYPTQRESFQILVSNSNSVTAGTTIACERTDSPLPTKARFDCVPPAGPWRYVSVVKTANTGLGFVLGEVRVYGHAIAAPYSYDGSGMSWTQHPGAASRITVDNAGNPWIVDGARNLQAWNGTGWGTVRDYDVQDAAIGGDTAGTIAIVQAGTQHILKSTDVGQTWTDISGSTSPILGSRVAVDQSGNVWVVDTSGGLSKYNGTSWTSIATPDGVPVADVGLCGGTVAVAKTSAYGNYLYAYNGAGWDLAWGQGVTLAGDTSGWVTTISTVGAVYRGRAPWALYGTWTMIRPAGGAVDVGVSPTTGAVWILSQ